MTGCKREDALRGLLFHDDYGLVDAAYALTEVERVLAKDGTAEGLPYEPVLHKLREIVESRRPKLNASHASTMATSVKKILGITFDAFDSMRRQKMARELIDELLAGRISHATAALGMREIVARSKGGWLK